MPFPRQLTYFKAPPAVSLRSVLMVSLLLFSVVPTAIVGWVMYRGQLQTVDALADKVMRDVAERVQFGVEAHLGQAHTLFNGLLPAEPNLEQTQRARRLMEKPATFEQTAFALTRMTSNVPYLYFGSYKGEFLGVESVTKNPGDALRVGVKGAGDAGRQLFSAARPGDRSQPLPGEVKAYDPRNRPWYQAAMRERGRVFTPVYPSAAKNQLIITLAQPVFGEDGQYSGATGVFAANLYLKQLSELLQSQNISAHGAAFLIDEAGYFVASSAGDVLYGELNGETLRHKPDQSANAAIRTAYREMLPHFGKTKEASVERTQFEGRVRSGDDALIVVMRPFGESLGLRWSLVVAAPENDFTADISAAVKATLLVMLSVMLVGAALAMWFAHRLSRRFVRLSNAASQLGRGELPEVQANAAIREVRTLSQVMRASAEENLRNRSAIQAQTIALRDANEHLEARVAERTTELLASREEALAAVRVKAAFLATMSHEIRTPLNGVVGMSTLLAETPLDPEQRDYLQTIRLSSDQLLAVINDVLDFSKIESGKLDLEREPMNLRNAAEEACDIAAPRAREKGLELIIDVPEAQTGGMPASILGDVTRLRQVLINLINNAVKFTEKGEVAVHARVLTPDDGQGGVVLEFRVTDTGIGIPPDRQAQLFEAFTQVDVSTTRKYGGTGLGLAICKRLVELMGGQIGVESELGRGSTFWFTLVAPRAEMAPVFSFAQANMLRGSRVLIVDDHPTNVRILRRQLQLWGMDVATAESAQQALQWLHGSTEASLDGAPAPDLGAHRLPDVIVTDMHMPDMDGVGLARAIKARAAWQDIALVLLSSGFMPSVADGASLFDARLLKPARQTHLFDTIARCILSDHALAHKPASVLSDSRKNITVLVADDNAVNLKVASAMLERLGYEVQTALDGRAAVDAVNAAMHNLAPYGPVAIGAVLMDVNMPHLDGLQATRQIRAAWGAQSPPIIALTASASLEDRARCLDSGMDDYLTKPLHVAALAQTLERWVTPADQQHRNQNMNSADALQGAALASGVRVSNADAGAIDAAMWPPAAPAGVELMNFERLAEFREFDDEALSMTREVIVLFRSDAAQRLEAIARAIAANDADALCLACHALAGSAGNIGAVALQSVGMALEVQAQSGAVPGNAAQQFEKLRDCWEQTHALLDTVV